MRTSLVTGATGLIGRPLIAALRARNETVVELARDVALTDAGALRRVLDAHGVDTVFHLAARATAGGDPTETYTTNISGTIAVCDAARRHGARRVVVASSAQVAGGDPTDPYIISKAAADEVARSYFKAYDLPVMTARCANVYGPGDRHRSRLIPGLVDAAVTGVAPVLRSGPDTRRDLLHVDDAVAAYLAIADRGAGGEAYNVSSGITTSLGEVVAIIERALGRSLGAQWGTGEATTHDVPNEKLRAATGWAPRIALAEGLQELLASAS